MTNKEKYQHAFSSLHTSENFKVRLEDNAMAAKYFKTRRALAAACAILALLIGGTSAYAADIGGIQRAIQIWIHGDLTDAILRVDEEEGTYTLTDGKGNVVEEGGGVAIEADGTERPLTSEEIAVISLGGIVSNKSIRIAGDDLTADIMEYMRRQHNMKVGESTAERIKINVGAVLTSLDNPPEDYVVHGPNQMTALPMEVPISYQEIAHCLDKSISKMEAAILSALEQTPPELYADIVRNGIYLAGGGAMIRGLEKRLTDKINIPFRVAEDPLHAVAKGTGISLKNIDKFKFLIK